MYVLTLSLVAALAAPPETPSGATEPVEAQVPTGPTEVMLLYGDVKSKVQVAGITTGVPSNVTLPQGEHEARITTGNGQLIVKRITVLPPTGSAQVIHLAEAPSASVQGHAFVFEVPGREGAIVFVDEAEAGPAPIQVLLSPGPHLVEVQGADGVRSGSVMELVASKAATTTVVVK